jgi:hypothetical protein
MMNFDDYLTFKYSKNQLELCSGTKGNRKPCNITPSIIQSVGGCIHGLKPLLTASRGLGVNIFVQVPCDVSDYEAMRAVDTAKYEELIRFGHVIDPDDPFVTNSRAPSPTPGGETIVVAAPELPPSSPSTIVEPLAGLEVIVRTLLLSSPPLFSSSLLLFF